MSGPKAPRNVTTEEFEALIRLIDVHHASTVGRADHIPLTYVVAPAPAHS